MSTTEATNTESIAGDILKGAAEIAIFVFGDPEQRRRVYWLAEHDDLPVFRIGQTICARRSKLWEWLADQESRGHSMLREAGKPGRKPGRKAAGRKQS